MKQSKTKVLPVSRQATQAARITKKGKTSRPSRAAVKLEPKIDLEVELEAKAAPVVEEHSPEFEELVLSHRENGRKLARSILRRWRVRMPSEEIDSVVDLSLCETAKRYSSNRGATFMTFFFYHLRGHLVRTVARAAQGNNVFLAFAKNAGVDAGDIAQLSTETLHSYVPDYLLFQHRDGETPENLLIRREKINQCRSACKKLYALEREVIDRSFGSEEALVDVAKSLGYSRCHISRVKRSALARLKGALANVVVETTTTPENEDRISPSRALLARNARRDRKASLRRNRRRVHGSVVRPAGGIPGVRAA